MAAAPAADLSAVSFIHTIIAGPQPPPKTADFFHISDENETNCCENCVPHAINTEVKEITGVPIKSYFVFHLHRGNVSEELIWRSGNHL